MASNGRLSIYISFTCLLLVSSCVRKIPDVTDFGEQTARLRTVTGAELAAVSQQHDALVDVVARQLAKQTMAQGEFDTYKEDWTSRRKDFDKEAAEIKAVLSQAVAYSESLVELAAAGKKGKEAGSSLLGSLDGFSALLGGPVLSAVTGVQAAVQAIAAAVTQAQAVKSLARAVETAQPAVDAIAGVLSEVYSPEPTASMHNIAEGLHAEALRVSGNSHGRNVINFCNTVEQFSDAYYLHVLNIVRPPFPANWNSFCGGTDDPDECSDITGDDERRIFLATQWRGYCKDSPGCQNLLELQALQVVRELRNEARPTCDAYQVEVESINAWRAARRSNARTIRSAVRAWAREHARVGAALLQKRSVSTSELKAILDELKTLASDS